MARRAEGPWPITPEMREKARGIEAVCFRHGVPLKAAALQFPLRHPVVACVLCGATTPEEMDENARLMQVAIPDATWVELQAEGLITNSSLLGGALDLNHAA